MSCTITYKGQTYTEEDFLEYIKNNLPTSNNLKALAAQQAIRDVYEKTFNESKQGSKQEIINNYYEGNIVPEPNTIFVFGSNPEGRHGAGAAKVARNKFGAIYGQGEGLQGNAYALPTKDLRVKENKGFKSISPNEIIENIKKLYIVAKENPTKQFKIAYRNTTEKSLNGYTGLEMIEMFNQAGPIPSNIVFSKEWYDVMSKETSSQVGQTFNNETSTDTYQYYGAKYEIITVDGVGVQVKDYKGSHQNQQKLLQAYNNNKDVDPQTGRKFRNLNSLEELEQKITGNVTSTAPTSVKKESSFTYQGITIDTEFQLGEQQAEALRNIIDYINEPSQYPFFTLQGYAGTGKTTVIGYVQKYFEVKRGRYDFRYMAPTHAATAQIALTTSKLGNKRMPSTVRSAVYEAKDPRTGVKKAVFTKKVNLDDWTFPVIIVDETSMLSNEDLNLLKEAVANAEGKLIFMGDNKQVPEVATNNPSEKNMNEAFQTENTITLDKVYRQSTSDLLDTLTEIRERDHFALTYSTKNNDGTLKILPKEDYVSEVEKDFTEDIENTVFIAYTNSAVQKFNARMKQLLNGNSEPVIGEKIVGYLGYATKQIESQDIVNSVSYIIEEINRVNPERSIFKIYASSKTLSELKSLGVQISSHRGRANYVQLSSTDSFTFKDVTQEQMDNTNAYISKKLEEAYNNLLAMFKLPNSGRKWAMIEEAKKDVADIFGKYDFGDAYSYDPKKNRLVPTKLLTPGSLSKDLYKTFSTEKGLDYGYGITVHKSQGMTVDNVYVDIESIANSAAEVPIKVKGKKVNTEKNALYYVAMSRARRKVVVSNSVIPSQTQQQTTPIIKPQRSIEEITFSKLSKYGFVDVITTNKNNKEFIDALVKYVLKEQGHDFKTVVEINKHFTLLKNQGTPFSIKEYFTVEDIEAGKTRVRLNLANLVENEIDDGPVSLGNINFQSGSGYEYEARNAFNCK